MVKRLKTETLNENEKIKIWLELKVIFKTKKIFFFLNTKNNFKLLSVARILATAHCYALTIVTFKLQKSILCRNLCVDLENYNNELNQSINW